VHWLRNIALVTFLGWLLLVALTTARAQEPTPEPTPGFLDALCEGASIEGGSTRVRGDVEITLPPGTYSMTIPPPNAPQPSFHLCHQETGGFLELNSSNCEEIRRITSDAEAEAVIDSIVESCQIAPAPTPEPTAVFACPEGDAISGGTTVTIGDNLQVSLPPGDFVVHVNEEGIAQVCNVDEEFSVYLLVSDCTAPAIAPPNDPHQEAIAQIKASCITLGPTPTPGAGTVTNIQPPNTGSAGLRR